MGNINTYLRNDCTETFEQREFTDVDSLILCHLAYLHFGRSIGGLHKNLKDNIAFSSLDKPRKLVTFKANNKEFINKEYYKTLVALLNEKDVRFRNVEMNYHLSFLRKKPAIQFSAIVYFLDDKRVYIAFRGSDGSTAGYREDMEMSFANNLPGQKVAVKYLDEVISKLSNDKIIFIGGHSKGGNFAKYAFLYSRYKDRIKKIFDHDGPGFLENIEADPDYKEMCLKLVRSVPEYDVVGLLLYNPQQKKVVLSSATSPLEQHFPHTWKIEKKMFLCKDTTTKASKTIDISIRLWLKELPIAKRRKVVRLVFDVLEKNNISSIDDFKMGAFKKMRIIFKTYSAVNPEDKKLIRNTLYSLFRCMFSAKKEVETLQLKETN